PDCWYPLMPDRRNLFRSIATGLLFALAAVGAILFLTPARDTIMAWFQPRPDTKPKQPWAKPVELIRDGKGNYGLRIAEDAMKTFGGSPFEVQEAFELRPMPPQIGQVNFDIDHLFTIRPR